MTRSLQTLLSKEPDATVDRVIQMLDECVQLEEEGYRCLNPTCTKKCTWPVAKGAGRSKLFCSKRCRQIHDRVRARLQEEIVDLEAVVARPDARKRQRVDLQVAIQQRKWALARYTMPSGSQDDEADRE
ncbi:MAG: hypothetical protein ACRCYU_20765 [Nocardioides sp.]